MDTTKTRRAMLSHLGATTFAACLASAPWMASTAMAGAPRWARRADDVTAGLRAGAVTIPEWRAAMDDVLGAAPLSDIVASIDTRRLSAIAGSPTLGVGTARVRLESGKIAPLSFVPKYFAIAPGRAIIPHGHANMVSAHLVLSGRLRLRQYDQVARDDMAMRVRATLDTSVGAGVVSSIDEARDNVHWFTADTASETLDIIVTGLDETAERRYEIFNLDMDAATPSESGTLRVPRLDVSTALAKYG